MNGWLCGALLAAAMLCVAPSCAAGEGKAIHVIDAEPNTPNRDVFVVWLSGDGGWGKMELQMTSRLAAAGLPTVGVSSFQYYARLRPPHEAATMIAQLVDDMSVRFGRHRFVLAGFSFGADVAPFVVNALPAATRAKLAYVALLSPGVRANFRIGPRTWLNLENGPLVAPEIARIAPGRVLCFANAGVLDDVCPPSGAGNIRSIDLAGGHILNNQYDAITREMVREIGE